MNKNTKAWLCMPVLACAAPAALADAVSLYGVIDTGFTYQHVSHGADSLEMSSGNYAGSRWGLRGGEKLSPDYEIQFNLESGFSSDSGEQGQSGSLFNREAYVSLKGPMGTIGAGRIGPFTSGTGSYSRYWDLEPFETGYMDAGIQATQVNIWSRHSNTLYYVSPKMQGFEFGAQYSFAGDSDKEKNGFARDDHFGNVYARWDGSSVKTALGLEIYSVGHDSRQAAAPSKTRWSVKWAGAWTPAGSPATLYAGANFYKNQAGYADITWDDNALIRYDESGRGLQAASFYLGGRYQIGSGALLAMVQYLDGTNKGAVRGDKKDYKRYVGSVGAHYFFSKKLMGYAVASYADGRGMLADSKASNRFITHVGLTKWF